MLCFQFHSRLTRAARFVPEAPWTVPGFLGRLCWGQTPDGCKWHKATCARGGFTPLVEGC